MFRKALNLSYYRFYSNINSLLTKRMISSQNVKTKEDLIKSEDKCMESKENNKINENNAKSLSEIERQELKKVLKSPVEMDSYWESRSEEKPISGPKYFDGKGGISADFMVMLQKKYDFSLQGIKRRIKHYIELREKYNQRYIPRRHAILGPELATAHFVVYRGGRVQFKRIDCLLFLNPKPITKVIPMSECLSTLDAPNLWFNDCEHLPNIYDKRYRLTGVDASNIKLRYEALDNLCLLGSLHELNLSNNKLFDDFMCDKIARLFRNSKNLLVLDISDNPLVTHRGIEALHRIRSLRKLKISGTKAAKYPFIELLIILFNDVNPNCEVII